MRWMQLIKMMHYFPNAEDGAMVQSGSVAIDPKTGGVQALVGGRGNTFIEALTLQRKQNVHQARP